MRSLTVSHGENLLKKSFSVAGLNGHPAFLSYLCLLKMALNAPHGSHPNSSVRGPSNYSFVPQSFNRTDQFSPMRSSWYQGTMAQYEDRLSFDNFIELPRYKYKAAYSRSHVSPSFQCYHYSPQPSRDDTMTTADNLARVNKDTKS